MNAGAKVVLVAGIIVSLAALGWIVNAALQIEPEESLPASSQTGYPREVPLPGGGALRLERAPDRVVAATARCIDFVVALVDVNRLAGAPEQAFEYVTGLGTNEPIAQHARFDSYVAEPVLALDPDLVIADPWQSQDTHARLREAGIPVLVLPACDDWLQLREVIELLGVTLAAEERARQVIADGDARVAALQSQVESRPHLTAVSYSNFGAQGFTAGDRTTLHEMMALVGLENLVATQGRTGHGQMTFEDLLTLDPDVIVVSRPLHAPAGPSGDRGGASENVLLNQPSLAHLRAVRERRIIALPAGLFASASHHILWGAEVLAEEVDRLLERLSAGEAP